MTAPQLQLQIISHRKLVHYVMHKNLSFADSQLPYTHAKVLIIFGCWPPQMRKIKDGTFLSFSLSQYHISRVFFNISFAFAWNHLIYHVKKKEFRRRPKKVIEFHGVDDADGHRHFDPFFPFVSISVRSRLLC